MMDLSDGLAPIFLAWRARASSIRMVVKLRFRGRAVSTIRQAISDGEDYRVALRASSESDRSPNKCLGEKFPAVAAHRHCRFVRKSKFENRNWSGYVHFK